MSCDFSTATWPMTKKMTRGNTMKLEDTLSTEHLKHLREGSGLSDEVILERGYRTITTKTALREYGFSDKQVNATPGLLIPQHGPDGSNGWYTFKGDKPRVIP